MEAHREKGDGNTERGVGHSRDSRGLIKKPSALREDTFSQILSLRVRFKGKEKEKKKEPLCLSAIRLRDLLELTHLILVNIL